MTFEEVKLQASISCLQGVLEAKHGFLGEILPSAAAEEALRLGEAFTKEWFKNNLGEVSDGYHTFNELYNYRMLYNAAFFNLLPKSIVYKSKRHHTGEECFGGGWFIVMANLPTGQISNHYELKDWDLFQIPEKEVADEWDGHTPQQAAERLYNYLLTTHSEDYKKRVTKLLDLVEKELAKGHEHSVYIPEDSFHEMLQEQWELGYNKGRMDALKDLPRWSKWGNGAGGNGRGIPIAIVKRGLNGYELVDALGIQGEKYIMISDLEKLPGFKD